MHWEDSGRVPNVLVMRRTLSRTIGLAALISATFTSPLFAADLRPAWTSTPVAIDGDASAPAWNRGTLLAFKGRGDNSTVVRLLEDAHYLYVAVRATQRERIAASVLQDGNALQADDSVALQFQNRDAQFTFTVNPFGAHRFSSSGSAAYAPEWSSAGRVLKGAYEITLRIPRAAVQKSATPWTLTVSRRIAALNDRYSSGSVALDADSSDAAFHAAQIVAGTQGTFTDAYTSLWPAAAAAPSIPQSSGGVVVKRSVGAGVTVVALDAHTASRDDNAQAIAFRSADDRLSATLSRSQTTDSDVHDTVNSVSLDYDDRAGTSAGVYWSALGDEAGAGSSSISGNAKRDFGALSVEGSAQSTRDELGNLLSAAEQATVAVSVGGNVNAAVDAQTNYDSLIGPYNENGFSLSYDGNKNDADVSYRAGHYESGFLQDARIAAAIKIAALGSLRIEHRQGNFYSAGLSTVMQQSTSVGIRRAGPNGSVSFSYQYVSGALPQFLRQASQNGGRIAISLDRYIAGGLLHANFNEQRSVFAAAPSFTVKFLPGAVKASAGAGKR